MSTAAPLLFQFTADPDTSPAVLEEYRCALEAELSKLPDVQVVETAETRTMGDGTILGVVAHVTPYLKDGALAVGALTTLLVSVRKLAAELGVWREVFIEPRGHRKQRLTEGSEAEIAATIKPKKRPTAKLHR
jgi:hypothetical protein